MNKKYEVIQMNKKYEAIHGLKCCIVPNPEESSDCQSCPYNQPGTYCLNRLKHDALLLIESQEKYIADLETDALIALSTRQKRIDELEELLKAKEPRVMTWQELANYLETEKYVWVECMAASKTIGHSYGWISMDYNGVDDKGGEYIALAAGSDMVHFFSYKDFLIHWRPWTCQPTLNQMKAVPWNEQIRKGN